MTNAETWGGLSCADAHEPEVEVVGIPFDGGVGGRAGAYLAPRHVRHLSSRLKTISSGGDELSDLRLRDLGDLQVQGISLELAIERIHHHYRELWRTPSVKVTIGGDHSVTFPIVSAATQRGGRWGVVWIDAHPDLLDSYLDTKISHGSPLRRIVTDAGVDPADVVLLGTRAYDREELTFLRSSKIVEIPAAHFHADSLDALKRARSAILELGRRVDHLYVSIDVDALDPAHAPGTGTPVGGGLTTGQVLNLVNALPAHVRGYDIVEYAPPLDVADITGQAVLVLLTEILARVAAARR